MIDEIVQQTSLEDLKNILNNNWRDGYTIPSARLYPFQWNWDAGFIALALSYFNQDRAMEEVEFMFKSQWDNGMLPHIAFHKQNDNYFPGPDIWKTDSLKNSSKSVSSTGITQPPVFGFILNRMQDQMQHHSEWRQFLNKIFPKVVAFHRYLYENRDPHQEGLVYIQHNWESGTDNSPLWDHIFESMDVSNARDVAHLRKDNKLVDASERPTNENYKRYIHLIDLFVACDYDDASLAASSPFLVQDVLFNSMLVKSNFGLIELGKYLNLDVAEIENWNKKTVQAINNKFWDETTGFYYAFDLRINKRIPIKVSSGFMPLFAGIASTDQAASLLINLTNSFMKNDNWYLCASCAFDEPSFNPLKYWRGPVWINVNWMLYHGLSYYGYTETAERIKKDSMELVEKHGCYEYFDPRPLGEAQDKRGIGADLFSWSAALYLDFVYNNEIF
jgi:hypothetical protein